MLAQDDAGEAAGRGVRGMDSQASAAKVCHRCHIRAAEKPEERAVGVDAQGFPTDVVRQPRQQGPAQSDRRSSTQALFAPANPVADGGVERDALAVLDADVDDDLVAFETNELHVELSADDARDACGDDDAVREAAGGLGDEGVSGAIIFATPLASRVEMNG